MKKIPLLIQDLGRKKPKENSTYLTRFGLYECPYCNNEFEAITNNVNRGMQLMCSPTCDIDSNMNDFSLSNIHNFIDYCPETGIMTRKKIWARRHIIGEQIGTLTKNGYLSFGINNNEYLVHRIAYFMYYSVMPSEQIDHINHNRTDNRISNLRCVDGFENHKNMSLSKLNSTGITGVTFDASRNKWTAQIRSDGRQYSKRFQTKFGAIRQRILWNKEFNFHINHGK
jgi:hypothetical protein